VKRFNRFVILQNDQTLHFRATSQQKIEWIQVALLNAAFLTEKYIAPIQIYKIAIQYGPNKCFNVQTLDNTTATTEIPKDKKYPLWQVEEISPDKVILKHNGDYISVDSQGRLAARTELRHEATIFQVTKYLDRKFSLRYI